MANIERYIAVEVEAFSCGMQKLFEGMAEVFSSIGMEEPERLQAEKRKWRPAEDIESSHAAEVVDSGEKSVDTHTDENPTESVAETPVELTAESAADPTAEPLTQKKRRKKTNDPAEPDHYAEVTETPADDDSPFDMDTENSDYPSTPEPAEETEAPKSGKQEEASVTADDITKIIVRKIKQNHSNNQRIGQLLKTYGVEKISNLPAAKYEAFVTDLAAL